MKTKLILVSLVFFATFAASAQTFVNYKFHYSIPQDGTATVLNTNILVPANTLFKTISATAGGPGGQDPASGVNGALVLTVSYPDFTNTFANATNSQQSVTPIMLNSAIAGQSFYPYGNLTVLGPAIINVKFTSAGQYNPTTNFTSDGVVILAELDAVNTTPAIQGFAVQPANNTANIALQTSTDLMTWTSTTNGTFPANNQARFFRMNLSVNP